MILLEKKVYISSQKYSYLDIDLGAVGVLSGAIFSSLTLTCVSAVWLSHVPRGLVDPPFWKPFIGGFLVSLVDFPLLLPFSGGGFFSNVLTSSVGLGWFPFIWLFALKTSNSCFLRLETDLERFLGFTSKIKKMVYWHVFFYIRFYHNKSNIPLTLTSSTVDITSMAENIFEKGLFYRYFA